MVRKILKRLEAMIGDLVAANLNDWQHVERLVLEHLPAKTNLVIPKSSLSARPPHRSSRMGRSRGALKQFRDERAHRSLHIKEYEDHWVVHADVWNPKRHPIRHLWVDHGYSEFLHLAHLVPMPAPAASPVAT
jgi:hypothetical protein